MPRLVLDLFGGFSATLGAETIPRFESDKVRALLAYLALESERPHARDELTTLLWSERPDAAARANLRQALANLQRAIANQRAEPPILEISRDSIQFNVASDVHVDALQFLALLREVEEHPHRSVETCVVCIARLERAVALYRGEFLAHFYLNDSPPFEEWLLVAREMLLRHAMTALGVAAAHYEQRGKEGRDAALRYARRQVELEPWREEPHRMMMRVLAEQGHIEQALAQYQTIAQVLQHELGVEPSVETRALYKHLRAAQGEGTPNPETEGFNARANVPSNLPLPTTPLVGRTRELTQLEEMFARPDARLVTLLGMGGIGKTRLALQFAHTHLAAFPRGVYFVDLAAVSAPEFIPTAIAEAMQFNFHGAQAPAAQMLAHLRAHVRGQDEDLLLVMDNFEHLVQDPGLVDTLLKYAPHVTLLVTSREKLNLQGEWLLELEGLPAPQNIPAQLPDDWDEPDAVQLFILCAARVGGMPNIWQDGDRRAVLHVTQLVEGMPLAIELAAAWVRTISPVEIANEIQRGLDLLATTQRNVPKRHASIRAVFEHSWELLTVQEQNVFARLAVFRGGMTREAARQVADASLATLTALLDKSLVKRTAAGRFRLHELVRQFAAEKLVLSEKENSSSGQVPNQSTRERHSRYYLDLLCQYGGQLNGTEARRALDGLRQELENIRAAWQRAVERADEDALLRALPHLSNFYEIAGLGQEGNLLFRQSLEELGTENGALAARLHASLALFLYQAGNYGEGMTQAQAAVAHGQAVNDLPAQAMAQEQWGSMLYRQFQFIQAREHFEQAVRLAERAGLPAVQASALSWLGNVFESEGDFATAERLKRDALRIAEELGDQRLVSRVLTELARLANRQFQSVRAAEYLGRALTLKRMVGDPYGEVRVLINLGVCMWMQHRLDVGRGYQLQALKLVQEIGDRAGAGVALVNLAEGALWMGDYVQTQREYTEALAIGRELQQRWVEFNSLWGLGMVHHLRGENQIAASYADEYLERARGAALREDEAKALILVAHLRAAEGDLERAAESYHAAAQAASELAADLGQPGYTFQAQAGLAAVALQQGNLPLALAAAEDLNSQFDAIAALIDIEPFRIFLTCYHIFRAAGDPRAAEILARAHELVQARAAVIQDAKIRTAFLENIPWHREIQRAYRQT